MEANNMAAMRKALERLRERALMDLYENAFVADPSGNYKEFIKRTIKIAESVLSAPPRNCDIYTDIDSAFRACQEDRGYLKSPIDERRSVISFMLSTNTSGEANKDEGEPDESK